MEDLEKTLKNIPLISEEEMQEAHNNFMRFQHENPNNFSYWFPHVRKLKNRGISIPESIIIPIPEDLYRAFFREREGDAGTIDRWVTDIVSPTIALNLLLNGRKLFIKNGCYSLKFDFANGCLITDPSDEETLIRHISNIQYDAISKETDGYLELVVREFIEPEAGTPTIYNGMPLRPEVRLFYAFDKRRVLYAANYWSWDYCHDAICYDFSGESTPDRDIYESRWPYLKIMTKARLTKHLPRIADALATVDSLVMPEGMPNIWSVDFILDEDRVWLIDMAQGWRSAYWNAERAHEAYYADK